MENQHGISLLTRSEVWESFDINQSPLETAILSKEKVGKKIVQSLCYTSTMLNTEKVRAYLQLFYTDGLENMPTVLILPNAGHNPDYTSLIDALVDKGYCVCLLDYAGVFNYDLYQTRFPSSLKYAQYPYCRSSLAKIHGNTVKDTAWYHWLLLIKRCLAVLKADTLVDYDMLSVIGFETGADLSWIIAGEEKKVSAVVPIGGGGAICKGHGICEESAVDVESVNNAFSVGIGAEIYAKTMEANLLFIPFTNSSYFSFSYAKDIFSISSSKNKQLLVDVGLGKQISSFTFEYLLSWLQLHYEKKLPAVKNHTTSLCVSDETLYFNLVSDEEPTSISLFYSSGKSTSINSLWVENSKFTKMDKDKYSLSFRINDITTPINYFATITYASGLTLSTPLEHVIASELGMTKANSYPQKSDRILYTSRSDFCPFRAETNSFVLDKDALIIKASPQKIKGIAVQNGNLYLPKPSNLASFVTSSSMLSCEFYTEEEKTLVFSFRTYPKLERYSYTVDVGGLKSWQKLVIKISDFKSSEGKSLSKLHDGFIFYIESPNGCLFNNLMLI